MPFGSGRKGAPEWAEMLQDDENEKKNKVICKHCNSEVSAKIERIRVHLHKCPKRTQFSRSLELEVDYEPSMTSSTMVRSRDSVALASPSSSSSSVTVTEQEISTPAKRKQTSMGDFAIKTTHKQKEHLDYVIAKFFYANNIAFNVASSKQYKEMIEALRPGYAGPDRFALAGTLLDKVADEVDNEIKMQLGNELSSITLVQDGWSNIKNDPIIATSIHTGQGSFLLNAKDCESNQKTAKYCAECAKESITMCEEKFGKKVFAVCTDSESKMVKMRQLLTDDLPDLLTYGCSAHYLNLLEVEVTPQTIIKHIVEVHKFFRNHHQPHGWLREKGGRMPQLPNSTRWNSQQECVSTFIENYSKYVEIITEHLREIPANIAKILDNVTIYRDAVHLLRQLTEVSRVLDLLQADSTNIAQAVELWLDLAENPDLEPYKDAITRRMNQALQPFHFLANLLDPRFKGRRMSAKQEEAAENWLIETHPEWLTSMMAFRISDPQIFPESMFLDAVVNQFSPPKWWKLMEVKSSKKGNLPKEFCSFMKSLSSCPASSASIERIFSTFGLVWSKLRNQLGEEKAKKLVKIYKFLHSNKE